MKDNGTYEAQCFYEAQCLQTFALIFRKEKKRKKKVDSSSFLEDY
jgi:hypothetical protein